MAQSAPVAQQASRGGKRSEPLNKRPNGGPGKRKKVQHDGGEDGDDEESQLRKLKFPKKEESPEEIAQWIEDRRKMFPTRARVEEKRSAATETKDKRKLKSDRKRGSAGDRQNKAKTCAFFQRGKCSKGDDCLYLHQKRALPTIRPSKQGPTLLEKVGEDYWRERHQNTKRGVAVREAEVEV